MAKFVTFRSNDEPLIVNTDFIIRVGMGVTLHTCAIQTINGTFSVQHSFAEVRQLLRSQSLKENLNGKETQTN